LRYKSEFLSFITINKHLKEVHVGSLRERPLYSPHKVIVLLGLILLYASLAHLSDTVDGFGVKIAFE
jgi:hypothetical protein